MNSNLVLLSPVRKITAMLSEPELDDTTRFDPAYAKPEISE
jgi:hypothetical protein